MLIIIRIKTVENSRKQTNLTFKLESSMLGLMVTHVFIGLIIDWYLFVNLYFTVCNYIYWNYLLHMFELYNYNGNFIYTCIY